MELSEQIKAQINADLRKRVYRAIQSMYGLFRSSPRDIQIVDKYMNVWKPLSGDVEDVVQFPYESKKGSCAEKKDAKHCLFAMITAMIKQWHLHCKDKVGCVEPMEILLDKIESVVKLRLELPVRGSDLTGHYLKLPKGDK